MFAPRRPSSLAFAALILLVVLPVSAGGPAVEDFTLRLGGLAFDPLEREPALDDGWSHSRDDVADLHLVQLDGPTTDAAIDAIQAAGLRVIQYIAPHTYVVWGMKAQRLELARAQVGRVRWTGDFAPAFRVQPQWRSLRGTTLDIKALIVRDADAGAVVARLRALGGHIDGRRAIDERFVVARLRLPAERMQAAASIPGIYSIRPQPTDGGLRGEMSAQINAGNVDGANAAFPGYQAWLAGVGVDGSGVLIAAVDGGVRDTHPDLVNRMLPCTGTTCSGTESSHGTHTAGIMAADGSSGTLDGNGFLRGLGVAPGAHLIEQVYSPTFTQPGGMRLLMTQSERNGAQLSGNSWGPAGTPQGYDDDTLQVDEGVRDADPDAPGNQPFTYVLSFMNGYGGTSSQGSPDEAKNIITVGSTKAQTSGGAQILEIDDLSGNSAHGPALDGRTIPHLVAPGCSVDSTDILTSGYGLKCGTSMASPHVSGAVALFIESWRNRPDYVADPSPALIKAALLASTRDLVGHLDADGNVLGHPFDSKQGWGRLDLPALIDAPTDSVLYWDEETRFDQTGQSWSTSVSALDPTLPVRVMLVWTDAPGHGLGGSTPAWNNDLDLSVEAAGQTYLGNVFGPDGWSATGGLADERNNTEGVFLGPLPPATLTIRVSATDINSDGVPGVGDITDQDFALVCSNCVAEPGFTLRTDSATRHVCAPQAAAWPIDVEPVLGFSDPVALTVEGLPAGAAGEFTVDSVVPGGSSELTVDTSGAGPGTAELTVRGAAGTVERALGLTLAIDTAPPAAPSPTLPMDGATDRSLLPLLQWNAPAQSGSYIVDVADDAAFTSIVYSATEPSTSHQVTVPLESLTTYWWRVRSSNVCGLGPASAARSFTTRFVPPLLLVDDDDNGPDVRSQYTVVLDALGLAYDVWDTGNGDSEPSAIDLSPYREVLWFTGDEFGGAAGPGISGEAALESWLDARGCLLISSQDFFYDRSLTGFIQNYLGVSSVQNDTTQTTVTGQGVPFGGLGPLTLNFPYSNYTDTLQPDATAQIGFSGNAGTAGVTKDTGIYRSSYLGFGLETVGVIVDRQAVVDAFINWCEALPTDDNDVDGVQNGGDCAPADATLWSAPSPVDSLVLSTDAGGTLTWLPSVEPGSTSAVLYDVMRSDVAYEFSGAACIEIGDVDTVAADPEIPAPGGVFHYLVRARNGCGGTAPDVSVCH